MGYTLVIDNYDSFTWNIYADIATLNGNPLVRRNDKISIQDMEVSRVGSPMWPCTVKTQSRLTSATGHVQCR